MTKTIRVSDGLYSKLLRVQGTLQLESDTRINLEDVLRHLTENILPKP